MIRLFTRYLVLLYILSLVLRSRLYSSNPAASICGVCSDFPSIIVLQHFRHDSSSHTQFSPAVSSRTSPALPPKVILLPYSALLYVVVQHFRHDSSSHRQFSPAISSCISPALPPRVLLLHRTTMEFRAPISNRLAPIPK
jgi:hypothetical protein